MTPESFDQQIERMQDELRELRYKEAEISLQLDTAKIRARDAGVFADSGWFRRATLALKKTRADIDQRQRAIKLLYKRWTYVRQNTLEHRFLQVAKERLTAEEFEVWMHQATTHPHDALQ